MYLIFNTCGYFWHSTQFSCFFPSWDLLFDNQFHKNQKIRLRENFMPQGNHTFNAFMSIKMTYQLVRLHSDLARHQHCSQLCSSSCLHFYNKMAGNSRLVSSHPQAKSHLYTTGISLVIPQLQYQC